MSGGGSGARAVLRGAAAATFLALGVFVLALLAAALRYPGGSWTAPAAPGFSLLRNFWCDLLRAQAINGADNAAARQLASAGFAALGLGMWPYWWAAGMAFRGGRRVSISALGMFSAAALAAMTLLPSDAFPLAHGIVALCGALSGMLAAAACVGARAPGEARFGLRRVSGLATLVFSACNALLYVHVAYLGGAETLAQPCVQKLATLALLTWMASSVRQALRGRGRDAADPDLART